MDPQFVDRILTCSDCHGEFIFTAGEQLFFHDKQFKNDPKRCKPCKSRRSGLSAVANGIAGPAAAGLSRTETRTECSECGVQTTVPFKPTQGRPVLCRQCFQAKARAVTSQPAAQPQDAVAESASDPLPASTVSAETAFVLTEASTTSNGMTLSAEAALVAAASMAAASPQSSVATVADLASITALPQVTTASSIENSVPAALVAAASADVLTEQAEA